MRPPACVDLLSAEFCADGENLTVRLTTSGPIPHSFDTDSSSDDKMVGLEFSVWFKHPSGGFNSGAYLWHDWDVDERMAGPPQVSGNVVTLTFPLASVEDATAHPDSGLFSPTDAARFMKNQWPELGDDILRDFKAKNEKPSGLERRFALSAEYAFISKQELESIFSKNASGWDGFYAKYPGSQGILTLSRVGFNEAKDRAVLYAGNQSHWVAGEGNVVLMKKMAGRWTVQGEGMMWIS